MRTSLKSCPNPSSIFRRTSAGILSLVASADVPDKPSTRRCTALLPADCCRSMSLLVAAGASVVFDSDDCSASSESCVALDLEDHDDISFHSLLLKKPSPASHSNSLRFSANHVCQRS